MEVTAGVAPNGLGQDGPSVLTIDWNNGHQGRHRVRHLRLACPCAQCVDEWSGEKTLVDSTVAPDVRPVSIDPVGLYGIQIEWSDGHSTGIYTFETLGKLCDCAECVPDGEQPA
jgi:ATP-binding protein involved in chromosome partitioning